MQKLTQLEINEVSGATIKPSHWLPASAFGATIGATAYVISSFSNNPISAYASLGLGALIGAAYAAGYEVLHENGY